jgi:hypothetical protein
MPKAQPAREPKRVKLSYDFTHNTFTTIPETPVLKKGDRVTFKPSSRGDHVHVILRPADAFDPPEFKTGDSPVKVLKSVEGMIWCGGTYHDPKAVPGKGTRPPEITIKPEEGSAYGAHTVDH